MRTFVRETLVEPLYNIMLHNDVVLVGRLVSYLKEFALKYCV